MKLDILQCTGCPHRMIRSQHHSPGLRSLGSCRFLGLQASPGLEIADPTGCLCQEPSNSCPSPSKKIHTAAQLSSKSPMGILQVSKAPRITTINQGPRKRAHGHMCPPDLAAGPAPLPGRSPDFSPAQRQVSLNPLPPRHHATCSHSGLRTENPQSRITHSTLRN